MDKVVDRLVSYLCFNQKCLGLILAAGMGFQFKQLRFEADYMTLK